MVSISPKLWLATAALLLAMPASAAASSLPIAAPEMGWREPHLGLFPEQLVGPSPLVDSGVRAALIEARVPEELTENIADTASSDPEALTARRVAHRRAAELLEAVEDYAGASAEYLNAIRFGAEEVWRDFGRVRELAGDREGAEAAYLAALGLPQKRDDPVWRGELYRDLGALYLQAHRPTSAVIALERAQELLPGSQRVAALLTHARIGGGLALPTRREPSPEQWPVNEAPDWRTRAEHKIRGFTQMSQEDWIDEIASLWQRHSEAGRWRLDLAIGCTIAMLLLLLHLLRHRGDLAVTIEYPAELRGTFNVRLSRQKGRLQHSPRMGRAAILKGGTSSRTEHHLVSRETLFPGLRNGRYRVIVEGILRVPKGGEILVDVCERQEVRILHWRTVRLEFDVRPDNCPVDVSVEWDGEAAREATLVFDAQPGVMHSLRNGPLRLWLANGPHALAIGSGDRVVTTNIEVNSYVPASVVVDVSRSDQVAFKGCPPAVSPYLLGDVPGAARALERDGQAKHAQRLLARWHQEDGRLEQAAEHYELAGCKLEAAELYGSLSQFERAAELYTEASESLSAAEMYRSAGRLLLAGQAYESALDFDSAIECYRGSGEVVRWIEALERRGRTFEAAQTAFENEERSRGIRLLQRVGPDESQYSEACLLLAEAYEKEGHWDLAAQKLEEYIASSGPTATAPDLYARLAGLLEHAGYIERALELLEDLRRREPTHPNVAARIEMLRKQRSANRTRDAYGQVTTLQGDTTALLTEQRYELLREVGRGGMGVVFQARDRRLGRVVALKQLPERLIQDHPNAVPRFIQEAQAAAKLNHPNIVTVYDADREDGIFFITMEMLMGESLQAVLRREGRLHERPVVQLGLQIAAGLEYAHQQSVVHRDIKTANLFLTTDNVVKIMDFGLAKVLEDVRSASTLLGGTPFYMSPEQVLGQTVDPRSDLYAFGVTLYELATGQVPFFEGEVAYHHCHTAPLDPRRRVNDVSDAFAELVLKLLAKKPEDRYGSALEVSKELELLLSE